MGSNFLLLKNISKSVLTNLSQSTGLEIDECDEGFKIKLDQPLLTDGLYEEINYIETNLESVEDIQQISRVDKERIYRDHLTPMNYFSYEKFGLVNTIYESHLNVFASSTEYLTEHLVEFNKKTEGQFEPKGIFYLSINADRFQRKLSLFKFLFFFQEFEAKEAISFINEGRMESIIPSPIHLKSLPLAFLITHPSAMCIPFDRLETLILLIPKDRVIFPACVNLGWPQGFFSDHSPIPVKCSLEVIKNFEFTPKQMVGYIKRVFESFESLLEMALANSLSEGPLTGAFQSLQNLSAINLILSDLRCAGTSSSEYQRVKLSFSGLDKLASFVVNFNEFKESDTVIFKRFFQKRYVDEVTKVFRTNKEKKNDKILRKVIKYFNKNYEELAAGEDELVFYIRAYRNLHHGAYLGGKQFLRLSKDTNFRISPNALYYHTYFLCLLWVLDPKEFIRVFSK